MRTGLDHLPLSRQRELAFVVRILFEAFEAATRTGTQRWTKQARILKLVLYGSFARGDWVDDPIGGYTSDYDILIVVNDDRLTDFELWSPAEDRLMRETTITKSLSAPVSFIVHSLTDVNNQLERGRPFFIDIVNQGIAVYEAEGFCFAAPRRLPPDEARAEAEQYYETWIATALSSIATADWQRRQDDSLTWRRKVVFELHQAAEQLYHCTLLTICLYSPKSHRLNFLRSQCEQIAPELIEAWPRADRFSRRCFELLRQAYVNARYSPHYAISAEELAWLADRVLHLQGLVRAVCEQRLTSR